MRVIIGFCCCEYFTGFGTEGVFSVAICWSREEMIMLMKVRVCFVHGDE